MADDLDPWRTWLRQHGPALLLFARQWTAHPTDAEDALQSGFLKFWKRRGRARDELVYLYACVRSAAMDQGRGSTRRIAREQLAGTSSQSAFEMPIEKIERQSAIEAALGQLPGDQREVVVMKIWGGLTFAQIAQALKISLGTAASRYRYALARLEEILSEEMSRE